MFLYICPEVIKKFLLENKPPSSIALEIGTVFPQYVHWNISPKFNGQKMTSWGYKHIFWLQLNNTPSSPFLTNNSWQWLSLSLHVFSLVPFYFVCQKWEQRYDVPKTLHLIIYFHYVLSIIQIGCHLPHFPGKLSLLNTFN